MKKLQPGWCRWKVLFFGLMISWVLQTGSIYAQGGKKAEIRKIPSLEKIIKTVFKFSESDPGNPKQGEALSRAEKVYEVKRFYYQILFKKEQLKIAEEVREHFEKAVTKSEGKYEDGEEDISQSDITKLKLGLAATENDIVSLKSGIELAKIYIGKIMGWEVTYQTPMAEESIRAVHFPFVELADFLREEKTGEGLSTPLAAKRFLLRKAFIKVHEAREKMNLAKKIKKITRALLVSEVANYDFGIGDSQELFEALIIYTRVLKGFYETIFNFNMAVADLKKSQNLPSSP